MDRTFSAWYILAKFLNFLIEEAPMKSRTLFFALAALLLLSAPAIGADVNNTPEEKAAAAADEIISMRSALAAEFIKPGALIDEETFKNVCGAVGKRAKEITEKTGLKIRHAAIRYRNPANAADEAEMELIKRFEADKALAEVWEDLESEGKRYKRYTRPIFVESACLACHGPKETRPEFIKEKYPDDRAYGFKEGDLRGIISVTVAAE